jgi:glycerate 2-kinase
LTKPRTDACEHVDTILDAALAAVDPARCVARALENTPDMGEAAAVIAIGKAAPGMNEGYTKALGEEGMRFMLAVEGCGAPDWACVGDHPLPTARNVDAARALLTFIEHLEQTVPPGAPVVLLLSGGASALLTLPHESVSLDEYRTLTSNLMRAGATIHELNTIRKHVEVLKGGRLAALLAPRPVHALILSDVIGDDLSVIGSGPVSPDPTTFQEAIDIMQRLGVTSPSVEAMLAAGVRGEHPETPKPGDPIFTQVQTNIIANNTTAVNAAADAARNMGYHVAEVRTEITGEAADVGREFATMAARLPEGRSAAIVGGGETTVNASGARGVGGPSTELALAAALAFAHQPKTIAPNDATDLILAAFATDGIDGPTDAAGAIVTPFTTHAAQTRGIDLRLALKEHDSHTALDRLNALIRTGPTGTNVNDLVIVLRSSP